MNKYKRKSRFLCYVLRHDPDSIGITLDSSGWADIDTLLSQAQEHDVMLTKDMLLEIVGTDEKKRYSVTPDGKYIRTNYGHSIPIKLDLPEDKPPERLFHGTASRNLGRIMAEGILSKRRCIVHLSEDVSTALKVGHRHGSPVILEIDAAGLVSTGFKLFRAPGGTWLIGEVPPEYIVRCVE